MNKFNIYYKFEPEVYFKPITFKFTFRNGKIIVGLVLKSNDEGGMDDFQVGKQYEFLHRYCTEVTDLEIIHQLNKIEIFK